MLGYGGFCACMLFMAVKIYVLFAWSLTLLGDGTIRLWWGLLVVDGMFCVVERVLHNEYACGIPWLWLGVLFSLAAGAVLIYDAVERKGRACRAADRCTAPSKDRSLCMRAIINLPGRKR